jgi:hypothetical protein
LRRMALGLHALVPLSRFGGQGQLLLLPAAGVTGLPAEDAAQLGWAHPWPGQISLCPPCSLPPVATLTSLLLTGVHR